MRARKHLQTWGISLIAACATTFTGVQTAEGALGSELVSHWPFEMDAGGSTPDVILDNDLVFTGFPIMSPGQVGNAVTLDGASYLSVSHDPDRAGNGLPIYTAGQYTISMWVKGDAQTAKYLFAHGATSSRTPIFIIQTGQAAGNNARLDVVLRNNENTTLVNHVVSASTVFDGAWHHVVWVDEAGNVRLYVDGVLDSANFSYTPAGTFTFHTTAVGTLIRDIVATGNTFVGQIDELALWERALAEEEVIELYANGVPAPDTTVPPTLAAPLADAEKRVGDWHLFTPQVEGSRPYTFQWFRNGEPIAGATGDSYRVLNLTAANSGDRYHVAITNAVGFVISEPATLTVSPDPEPNVSSGLLNHWPLDEMNEENGGYVSPDEYSGNDLVLVEFWDPSKVVPGKFDNALAFEFGNYGYRTNGAPIYSTTNYSISMWVQSAFGDQVDVRVFSEGASSGNNNPLFTIGTDNAPVGSWTPSLVMFIRDDNGAAAQASGRKSTRPVFDGNWHHIVWTDENGKGKLYVDGVLDETDYTYTRPQLTLDVTSIGAVLRQTAGNYFNGNIDDVATWNRVLSWTEIQEIFNEGIPPAVAVIPPEITVQPTAPTLAIYSGDQVSLAVQSTGTQPLTFEWSRNGQVISAASNPSAATATLMLANAQAGDSGTYTVRVANQAGSDVSDPVELTVNAYTPVQQGVALAVDIGPATNLEEGFVPFMLAQNGSRPMGVKMTVAGVGGAALAERNRTTGNTVVNNPPDLTQAELYNDFIFANNATDLTGLSVLLENLAPSTPYEVTIWSFDRQSTGDRFAEWSEISGAEAVPLATGYTFNGSLPPAADNQNTIQGVVTSSAQGTLLLQGLKNGGTSFGVFLNAIRLVANPSNEVEVEIANVQLVDGKLRMTVQAGEESRPLRIDQNSDLGTNNWIEATNGTVVSQNGGTTVVEFPASGEHMFYRASVTP